MSDETRCRATCKDGAPCGSRPERGREFCRWHRANSNRDDSVTEILSTFTPAESQQGAPIRLLLQPSPTGWEASLLASDGRVAVGPEEVPREIPWAFEFWAKVLILCPLRALLLAAPHAPHPLLPGASEIAAVWGENGAWVFYSGPDAFALVPQAIGLACRFNGFGVLLAWHETIPLRADGLPDLRVLTTPREQWGTLGVEEVAIPVFQRLPAHIPQATFPEWKGTMLAIADGRTGQYWEGVEGDSALAHRRPDGTPNYVIFQPDPERAWWGTEVTHSLLLEELKQFDPEATMLALVVVGEILREGTARLDIDTLVKAVGWEPRSVEQRAEQRRKVHRWLRNFAGLKLGGTRRGVYRDPMTKEVLPMDSYGALFHIDEISLPAQRTLLPGFATPLGFELSAGKWLKPHLGNRQILTQFGEVRRLANIPGGKPSGAWARGIGIALQQGWRQQAARVKVSHAGDENRAVVHFQPFTRKELLGLLNFPPDVNEILAGEHPQRAVGYWNEAVKLLREAGVIGPGRDDYRELEPLPETRQGWGAAWLGQTLQIRPGPKETEDVVEIHTAAQKAKRARKGG